MGADSIFVRLMSGPHDGLQLSFPLPHSGGETVVTIGRSEECDVALPYDSQVSRTHAQLVCTPSDDTMEEDIQKQRVKIRLLDLGSRNGTYLGEQRLKGEGAELNPGELFRVGRTWLRVDP